MGGRSYRRGSYGSRHPTATGIHNRYQARLMSQQRTKNSIYGPGFRRGNGSFRNGRHGNGSFRNGRHGNGNGRNGNGRNGNGRNGNGRNGTRKSFMGGFFEKFASEIKKIAN